MKGLKRIALEAGRLLELCDERGLGEWAKTLVAANEILNSYLTTFGPRDPMKLLDNSLCKVEIAALEITRTQFEDRELYAQALVTLTIVKKEVFRINVSYRDDYEELRAIVDDLRYSPWEFKTPDQVLVFNQIVDRLEKKVHEPE